MRLHSKLIVLLVVALIGAALVTPATAFAASPTIITPTKAEDAAYSRCVNAAMAYAKKPQTITVNIKDLKLSYKQVVDVETRLHSNGELWWINTFALGLTTSKITMPCKYSDATITKMRKKFDAAVNTALKRLGPGMTQSQRVHMLHDYIITEVKYKAKFKNAYEALVNKRGDCFGYTLGMDALLRRAGFSTDVAFNNKPSVDHSWNLVRMGSTWYHVDTTWDRYYTYTFYKGKIYHRWLLQSDKLMNGDWHEGWEAHHRCTSGAYERAGRLNSTFNKQCNLYKNIVRSFAVSGLKYTVTGVNKVSLYGVTSNMKKKRTVRIPATVTYKNVKYSITGIQPKTFVKTKAKILYVGTGKLTKASTKSAFTKSKLKIVYVAKSKLKTYKKCFAKSNSGKRVTVKATTAKQLQAA